MKEGIYADVPLDYAEFQIFACENRYEVCVCSGNIVETLTSGLLQELLKHIPRVKDFYSEESNSSFKLQPPLDVDSAEWFTKSTLTRFLHIVGVPDLIETINATRNEISQLEEARRFHLSLYAKGHPDHPGSEVPESSSGFCGSALSVKTKADLVSSESSKNELLRALDLRLTALRKELSAAINKAAGATLSFKTLRDLEKFSHHFGAINLRDSLQKTIELDQAGEIINRTSDNKSLLSTNLTNGRASKMKESTQISEHSNSDTPVKYGVSPAKVAQVERQTSSESGESSYSSEEDQPSVERSRTLVRIATPRRSASPMRRIQIGRSGSRTATALTIKSLNYFPSREKVLSQRDGAASCSEGESEQLPKNSENNVRRMSVQDAINLFESKQRSQSTDIQKAGSMLNVAANKSVLRRWSSGMGENSARSVADTVLEGSRPVTPNHKVKGEISNSILEAKPEPEIISAGDSPLMTAEIDVKVDSFEKGASNATSIQVDIVATPREESKEKLVASAEWIRQKEAELNQLLMKVMESKPTKYRNKASGNRKGSSVPSEQKGGFHYLYKEKREEKLQGETAGKKAEKQAQFRAMQKILDERKAEMASANGNEVNRRHSASKPQKLTKNLSQPPNLKKETTKPAMLKKALPKASPLPATRKSWPSTPSPRLTGTSPAKTHAEMMSAGGNTPVRKKPQAASSVPRANAKVERSQPRPKTLKATTQNDANTTTKVVNAKKQQTVTKNEKSTKKKVHNAPGDHSSTAKLSLYNKMTKKSSVVPLESKPFVRKGSGNGPGNGKSVKTKVASPSEESMSKSEELIQAEENEADVNAPDLIRQQDQVPEAMEVSVDSESRTLINSPQMCEDAASSNQVAYAFDDNSKRMEESASKTEAEEESIISPSAWVEVEEHQDQPIPCDSSPCQLASPTDFAQVGVSSQHIRHSLSQMLIEDSSEPDIIEWGNAENPPAMVYQKDAPKGFKRLLKFARKSKGDANLTGWSSPSALSEGEDDGEESKASSKGNTDGLLRKATLNSKHYGQQKASPAVAHNKNSAAHGHSAQSNLSRFGAQKSHKLQGGTSKATRSFFSLSAFRGSKP